ncbi:IclR family transcriptional regulator [Rhizobium rhizogenes]|uniref:IclR family transcriptional regulator n=1 Tax=Rhizobium rhizogenes TaxID=359 RepID=UPI001572C952|nr:IclR family transcriptional regulator [Rhizobium rhizogenes]NTH22887.1 IclR family transcriptional regulator [Rhizobium rhizogenes]NTH35916.1 IclR family transcriptional regulator [Rhizobium rhizogenes]
MKDEENNKAAEGDKVGSDRATVRAVDRAFDLLGCFSAEQKTITLTEAARAVELPLSTVSRLLGTLEASQFVRRLPDGRYMPGGRLLRIGVVALHGVELYDSSQEYLERLAKLTGESANLAVPTEDNKGLYIRQVPSIHTVRHDNWIGRSIPMVGTAMGAALRGEVGKRGYALQSTTLEPDVTAIAAPIFGPDGQIVAAISVTAPSYRVNDTFIEWTGENLVREAREMSRNLGASEGLSKGRLKT